MRLLLLFLVLFMEQTQAQQMLGTWHGALDINGMKLRLVLHIAGDGQGYTAKMDSPDQGVSGIPVESVVFTDGQLKLKSPAIGASYEGILKADTLLEGIFSQGGQQFPLRLVRRDKDSPDTERPQEPKPPFAYESQEVSFENKRAGVTLAGTLTLPGSAGPHPAVILITGSGPQNRDEELLGHKPFLLIADYLTQHGIAVLRYDDRGVGRSTGDFGTATSADFASDAVAALDFLKDKSNIDPSRIGLLGHSEGGMVATMVAAEHTDVAFLVLLAAPGIPIDSLMRMQRDAINKASGAPEDQLTEINKLNDRIHDLAKTSEDTVELDGQLRELISPMFDQAVAAGTMTREQATSSINQQVRIMASPWMRYFLKFDPKSYLQRVKCPVLALNGGNDLQVAAKPNLSGIDQALKEGCNSRTKVKEMPGLNHLFQESNTGLPAEYGIIKQTMAPTVLQEIQNWMVEVTRAID